MNSNLWWYIMLDAESRSRFADQVIEILEVVQPSIFEEFPTLQLEKKWQFAKYVYEFLSRDHQACVNFLNGFEAWKRHNLPICEQLESLQQAYKELEKFAALVKDAAACGKL